MKILITSDIHGRVCYLDKILQTSDFDLIIDAGDSNLEQHQLKIRNILSVKGNTDYYLDLPLFRIIDLEIGKVLITHGHQEAVKWGLSKLRSKAEHLAVDYDIFGHTHQLLIEEINGIKYLNPGSLGYDKTYLVIDKKQITRRELKND